MVWLAPAETQLCDLYGSLQQPVANLIIGSAASGRLQGGTLLHVAAEYGNVAAAALLLDRGADVNARATVDEAGIGGQTAIFHAVTQFGDDGLPITQLLLERGADLRDVLQIASRLLVR
jgi:ankyrin repeat protein